VKTQGAGMAAKSAGSSPFSQSSAKGSVSIDVNATSMDESYKNQY
jgi:hypothetical protein